MVRAEPVLEKVHVVVVAQFFQRLHVLLPVRVDRALIVFVTHVREHVALQHLCQAQAESPIIHGFEDRVGVLVGIRLDLDDVHVLQQPVDKEWQCHAGDFLRQVVGDVGVPRPDILDRLARAVEVQLLAVAVHQLLHHL